MTIDQAPSRDERWSSGLRGDDIDSVTRPKIEQQADQYAQESTL